MTILKSLSRPYTGALALAVISVLAVFSTASAAVVYGNLGSAGNGTLAAATNVAVSDTTWLMHGFTVGGTDSILQTVTLGLFDNDSTTARVQIFADASGVPGGSALGSQTGAVATTTPSLQTFNFGNLPLVGGSSYWVVVSTPTASSLFNWAFNDSGDFPGVQNASGWAAATPTVTKISTDSGANWAASGVNRPASISISAVPEPDTLMVLGTAMAAVAGGLLRRRLRKTN